MGQIFVRFADGSGAIAATEGLSGRKFASREIECAYVPTDRYEHLQKEQLL